METKRSVLLVGATGLVGQACLRRLLDDPGVGEVRVFARRPLAEASSPRLAVHVVDFDRLDALDAALFAVDQVACALGTTIRQAGSQDRFRAVDYGYPLAVARRAAAEGARHLLLVSALGADARSRVFYNRVKGELEDAVRALPFRSVTLLRPSLLLGDRPARRPGEEIGKRLAFLVPPRYKPIPADTVAAVLVRAAREDRPGVWVIENAELRRMG